MKKHVDQTHLHAEKPALTGADTDKLSTIFAVSQVHIQAALAQHGVAIKEENALAQAW